MRQLGYDESENQIDCNSLQRVFSSWSSMEGGEVVEARRSHSEMGAKFLIIINVRWMFCREIQNDMSVTTSCCKDSRQSAELLTFDKENIQ